MNTTLALPYPTLDRGRFAFVEAYTDNTLYEETGVRIAFTTRKGGVSKGSYESLNLGTHVHDDALAVKENRRRVLEAFASPETPLMVPNQVHGDTVLSINAQTDVLKFLLDIAQGADGLVIGVPDVAALLCYADCVPVIIVSPTKRFAVVHAGWRGVMNTIACKAVRRMVQEDLQIFRHDEQGNINFVQEGLGTVSKDSFDALLPHYYNVYIGPHIHGECFETSVELHEQFIETFGQSCDAGYRHIALTQALRTQLEQIGIMPERICDLGLCTVCNNDEFFSYRAQDGVAGRHGAFAYCAK